MGVGDGAKPLGLGAAHSLYRLMYPGMEGVQPWTRESAVLAPSEMIAIGDPFTRAVAPEQDGLFKGAGEDWKPIYNKRPRNAEVIVKSRAAITTHRSRLNRVFCDGHVEVENFTKPFVATDEYLRRWNYDHEPHRDIWETSY